MTLFRRFLILGVSSLALITEARAAQITTKTTEQARTSTADSGAPDDITITSEGSIEEADQPGFTALVIDSSHDVTIAGTILIEDSDDTTGILITPGVTSDIVLSGSIQLIEDYTRTDLDEDGDLDGPVAIGTGRAAILLESGAPLTGKIHLQSGSYILVEGNESAGVRLLGPVTGDIITGGSISVTGANAQGLTAEQRIDGDVTLKGSISANGENATGVRLDAGATGAVEIGGSIIATGFVYSGVSNYVAPSAVTSSTTPLEERLDADELLSGGPALFIGGSIGRGLLINGSVADPDPSDDEDEDTTKDTIEDFNENRSSGTITSYGPAPALLISADWAAPASEDLVLGKVLETIRDTLDDDDDGDTDEILAQFQYEYGLINRGLITGAGTNVGFDGTAVQIEGSLATGHSVIIEGGIENTGSMTATAYEANATALRLGANVQTPLISNSGAIQAMIATETSASAVAVSIGETASLPQLENSGTIYARSRGNAGEVAAVQDLSGTLSSIVNTGSVIGLYEYDGIDLNLRTDAVAFDLRASTSGVTLLQYKTEPTYDANGDGSINGRDTVDPVITGDILFGSGDDQLTLLAGTLTGNVDFGSGANELYASNTAITGKVNFDGEESIVRLLSGTEMIGDVSFGSSGTASFVLSGGSTYSGLISNGGADLSMAIAGSRAQFSAATALDLASLSVSGGSELILNITPGATQTAPVFSVSGAAMLADGVTIKPVFSGVADTSASFSIIRASEIIADLTAGDIAVLTDTPYVYLAELQRSTGAVDELNLVYRLKTTGELGLDLNQSAAFGAVLELFLESDSLNTAFAGITTEADFFQAYNQLLPQRTDASTRFLRSQSTAVFGTLADRMNVVAASSGKGVKGWVQESYTFADIKSAADMPGYNGFGISISGGLDIPMRGLDAFGVMMSFNSGRFEEKTGGNNPVSTSATGAGLYAMKKWNPFYLRGAAQVSAVSFDSLRELNIISGVPDSFRSDADVLDTQDISDEVEASWSGVSLAGTVAAGTELRSGSFYARPEVSVDYFRLSQDSYRETALRRSGLALEIGSAETQRTSAAALITFGNEWEVENGLYRVFPEARIGYRHEVSGTPYEANARFVNGSETFLIQSQEDFSDAVIAGLSINSSSSIFTGRLSYDGEISSAGVMHYIGASGVLRF